jgi:DNA-binding NarL/FixJ family response regulator
MLRINGARPLGAKHRVFIVDDQLILRQALTLLLAQESSLEVCGEADAESEATEQIRSSAPDLVMLGVSPRSCLAVFLLHAEIREWQPDVKTLMWLATDKGLPVERALRAGANGYLSKDEPFPEVVCAIHKVLENESYMSPMVARDLLEQISDGKPSPADPQTSLSARELEVFKMIGRGLTTQQIAAELRVSPKTVETHRTRIKQKLVIDSGAQLNYRATYWSLQRG